MSHESSGVVATAPSFNPPSPAFPSVHHAWSAVMADLQAIGKDQRNNDQGFNFRGIDDVMNAVGPILRKHGVFVVPTMLSVATERYETKRGAQMVNRVVGVAYTVHGPAGDHFVGASYGEASDSGDKAIAKAQSVAYRTFLLQALTIPTNEPDPDATSHERGPQYSVTDPTLGLLEALREAVDQSAYTRESASDWFYAKYGRRISDGSNHELEAAIRHFSTAVTNGAE